MSHHKLLVLALAGTMTFLTSVTSVEAGQVSLRVEPRGQAAEVVGSGLQIYSLFKSFKKNRAKIDQHGTGNGAAIAQHGDGNYAQIFQRGHHHSGQITQTGNNNTFGLFQFGRATNASASQTGNGRVGFEFVGGW